MLEPDVFALVEQFQHVAAHPDEARATGAHALAVIQNQLSWQRIAETILSRLESIREKSIRQFTHGIA